MQEEISMNKKMKIGYKKIAYGYIQNNGKIGYGDRVKCFLMKIEKWND